jgi:hypothetical protein
MRTDHVSKPQGVVLRPKPVLAAIYEEKKPLRHEEREWEAVYPHVKRMYLVERRKLRQIIAKLESDYCFKTT